MRAWPPGPAARRCRPLHPFVPVIPPGEGDHRPLLPIGEKVPEGRIRLGARAISLLGPVVFSEDALCIRQPGAGSSRSMRYAKAGSPPRTARSGVLLQVKLDQRAESAIDL